MSSGVKNKLGTSFHRTFPIQRAPLAEYLRAIAAAGRALTFEEIRSATSLGTVKVESTRRYARATRSTNRDDGLSSLGNAIVANDPYLNSLKSTWLLHAAMMTNASVAPDFWGHCWREAKLGETIDRAMVSNWIGACKASVDVNSKTIEEAATVFLTSYSKVECLGDIGLLVKTSKGYEVRLLESRPALGVVAWFIGEQWDGLFPGQVSVNLEDFIHESQVMATFKLSREACDEIFRSIADRRICELYLSAPPFQIVRAWGSSTDLIERIYEDN